MDRALRDCRLRIIVAMAVSGTLLVLSIKAFVMHLATKQGRIARQRTAVPLSIESIEQATIERDDIAANALI